MSVISKITIPGDDTYDVKAVAIPFGQVDSTSTSTAFTATIPGITALYDGVCMWLRNGVVTANYATIDINNLGAKPIYHSQTGNKSQSAFEKSGTHLFIYNSTRVTGGCWDLVVGYNSDTAYTPQKLGFGYGTCGTAEATIAKAATLSNYGLVTNGIVSVKFTNAVPANSTLNINSKGAKSIYYQGSAITGGVIKAGDIATFIYSTQYHLIAIDRWGKYIDEVYAPLKELVDNGAKNLIKLGFSTKTVGTVTGTMTADGNGILINGERTQTTEITLIQDIITDKDLAVNARYTLPVGKYVLAAATAYAQIAVYAHDGLVEGVEQLAQAGDSAVEFEYTSAKKMEKPYLFIRVLIRGSHNFENETIYPMICTKAQWDISHAYEPYALTNPELTAKLTDDEAALVEIVDGGDKNKLLYNGIGAKQGNAANITFTYNSDGSITVNGSVDSTGNAYVYLQLNGSSINAHGEPDFCTGDFVLSGCPKNGNGLSLRTTGTGYDTSSDTGEGVVINPASSGVTVRIVIMVAKGNTVSNLTVKPMICTKAAWQVSQTYEPYKPDDYVGTELQPGDNLNNLSRGRYYCRSAAISAQILNNPNTGSGFVVDHMYNGNAVQILYPVSSTNTIIYKRSYASSAWRPWCKFEGTEVT